MQGAIQVLGFMFLGTSRQSCT